MRRSKVLAICGTFVMAAAIVAQQPVGFIRNTLNSLDWFNATASGCTPGSTGMCVGAGSPWGDTLYMTAWLANSTQLPVATGLPIVGTLNDYNTPHCAGNIGIVQLSVFDWSTPNASKLDEINCMSSMVGTNSPTGWYGHATSGDNGTANAAVWHSHGILSRGGKLYLVIYRTPPAGLPVVQEMLHDITMLRSDDGGATWRNPHTVAASGASQATGDAPLCGALSGTIGSTCTDAAYAASIMWPGATSILGAWNSVEYMQDGATPPSGITDGCDPATYTCFVGTPLEGTLSRVLNTDLPSLDVTKWQYYTCPAITDTYRCPGGVAGSWTSTFANRTRAGLPIGTNYWQSVSWLSAFNAYLAVGADGGNGFAWAPTIQGPWNMVQNSTAIPQEFPTTPPSLQQVIGTNHMHITVVGDSKNCGVSCNTEGAPTFTQWDVVLGRTPAGTGDGPVFNRFSSTSGVIGNVIHSGLVISDSHAPGTIPRNGLAWAFDLYDHGGYVYTSDSLGYGTYGFHDIANGSAFLQPCIGALITRCQWVSSNTVLQTFGGSVGGTGTFASMMHETPQTVAIGAGNTATAGLTLQNAPSGFTGNGTFSVITVFRPDALTTSPVWFAGDYASGPLTSNSAVDLAIRITGKLSLLWGFNFAAWGMDSNFVTTAGDWYFTAVTVQANGANPICHMWVGSGGALSDALVGISRVRSGGTAVQTPNVSATPFYLGEDPVNGFNAALSYAGLYIYNRALNPAEVGLMYMTLQANAAKRGLTVQ